MERGTHDASTFQSSDLIPLRRKSFFKSIVTVFRQEPGYVVCICVFFYYSVSKKHFVKCHWIFKLVFRE